VADCVRQTPRLSAPPANSNEKRATDRRVLYRSKARGRGERGAEADERVRGMRVLGGTARRQPSCGRIGAVVGPRVEGNRRARGCLANRVDDYLEN
jgi:hypothetical protein